MIFAIIYSMKFHLRPISTLSLVTFACFLFQKQLWVSFWTKFFITHVTFEWLFPRKQWLSLFEPNYLLHLQHFNSLININNFIISWCWCVMIKTELIAKNQGYTLAEVLFHFACSHIVLILERNQIHVSEIEGAFIIPKFFIAYFTIRK